MKARVRRAARGRVYLRDPAAALSAIDDYLKQASGEFKLGANRSFSCTPRHAIKIALRG